MKYSRSAITQLSRWYKQVLIKCAILNAAIMAVSFGVPAIASDISGVTPDGNTYNIEGAKFSGSTQFRQYNNFTLDNGDVANLIYKLGYDKFVNMVDSQVNINGIVNTMQNNNFFNGHAIFVSPNGIVVGASGILNVGSLTLATPSQAKFDAMKNAYTEENLSAYRVGENKYKEILTDSHGNVVINGKIMARGDVEIYGDTISIKGTSADKAGVVAGVKNQEILKDKTRAKEVFDSLVSNNISDTKNFALENGKIKIVAGFAEAEHPQLVKKSEIKVDNAEIGGEKVEMLANSTTQRIVDLPTDTSSFNQDHINSLGFGVADEATSKIEITNSEIGGKDINIEANSLSTTKTNVNLLKPTIFDLILNDDAKASEYFSKDVFTGFEGGRANAIVKIENSILNSTNNVDIATSADAELEINSKILGQAVPALLYGLGTKTVSTIDIIASEINADSDVNVNAISSNDGSVSISNSSLVELDASNALVMTLLNYSNITDTHAIIDNSQVNAANLDVVAINMSETENELNQTATVGKNDFMTTNSYGSGAAFSILFNRTKNDVKALIKDSTITVEGAGEDGGLRVIAQSLNVTKNAIEASADDDNYRGTHPTTFDQGVKDTIKAFKNNYMKKSIKSLFSRGNMNVNMDQADDAKVQASGVFLWNVSNNNATAKIENSTVTAKSLDVNAYTVDLTANQALTDAVGEAYFGGTIALIINDEINNTIANINKNAKIEVDELNLNATTQMPMNAGSIKFGLSLPVEIFGVKDVSVGVTMEGDPAGNWDFSSIYPGKSASTGKTAVSWEGIADQNITDTYGDLKPKLKLGGFFNNFAQASANGNTGALSATVVVNNVENNTTASIADGSNVKVKNGDAILNAVNSVMGYNAVGIVDYLVTKINYYIPGQQDWGYEPNVGGSNAGIGGSVLLDTYTNNATAKIDNSTVKVEKGDLTLASASEQAYLSALATGGTSEKFVLDGSVHVQNLKGTTAAEIINATSVEADNISISAGKARIKPTSSNIQQDTETSELKTKDERDAKDKILNIIAGGALAQQSAEGGGSSSSGAAVGADVNVVNINRTIGAKVNNSTLIAQENVDANAKTENQNINISFAGAFAGGVSTNREQQENANNGAAGAENQQMQNAGNWMDILDDANDNDDDILGLNNLFNDNNPNAGGAQNAGEQAGNVNQLADGVADPAGAANNFSLAAAGSVSVLYDESAVKAEIINSTLNVAEKINVKSDRNNFMLNVSGGIAKAGNVGGGAAVNVYTDKGKAIAQIDGSTISFNSDNAKEINVTTVNNHKIIEGAVGVGVASNDESGIKAAIGGSFSTNALKDETKSIINNTTIQNTEDADKDININVDSKAETIAWNVGGDLGFAKGSDSSFALGAGVAGNLNLLKQTVVSEITNSKNLTDLQNVTVNSALAQEINSIAIAGAVVTGAQSSFTIDGALGIDLIENTVTSQLKNNSKISASGDIKVDAKSELKGKDLTGSVDVSTADSSLGVGIGAVVEVDNSKINAKIDNSKIIKSKSVEVKADSSDDRKFLAANLGVQTGSGTTVAINANGIVGVLKSTVNSSVINGSEVSSDGLVNINSIYKNKNQGITAVGAIAKKGGAIGANIIATHYGNEIIAELSKDSKILQSGNIGIGAKSSEYISMIPVAVAVSSGGFGSVAANIAVNVIKDSTTAKAEGNLVSTGNLTVAADSETTIYNRGGTLAIAGADAAAAVGGSINVDYIGKTVNAYIGNKTAKKSVNVGGLTTVSALSTNSLGGTPQKDAEGNYIRDDITSETYQDNLMKKDSEGHYSGINYSNDFGNWNMFYNLAAGATAAISGAVVVKTIDNTVTAEILNSDLTSNNMKILAEDYSIKNIIAGQISASSTAAIGATVLVTKDNSNTSALISQGSDVKVTNALDISAFNTKDNNQIVVSGNGSGTVAGSLNVIVNKINDKNYAKIDGSTVKAGTLNMTADEDMNASHIVVSASGSGNVAINVSPLVNKYEGETVAQIAKSTINDAAMTLQSDTNIKTRDIMVGVAVTGVGAALQGLAIKNTYDTTTKSTIEDNSIINTSNDVILNANSVANSNNWIAGLSFTGEGASVITNVIINNMISDVETNISDSNIRKAGKIALNTNKNKKDNLQNYGIAASGTAIGGAAVANVIYNIYENDVTSKIYNTSVDSSSSITAQAFSDREIKNYDIGVAVSGLAVSLLANALVNEIGTDTLSYVDAQSKTINTSGKLIVKAEDNTFANNTMGFGSGGAGALGANINLYYSDNLARAEVLSNSAGQINAGSSEISSKQVGGLDNTNVGVVAGLAGIAGDVVSIKLGKHLDYTDSEKKSGIKDADNKVKEIYNKNTDESERNFRTGSSSKIETGAVARVKGNLKSTDNIDVKAETKLKGKDADGKLTLRNVDVTAGIGTGSVAVRNVQLSNNAIAEIAGGTVESTSGKVSVNAKNNSNVDITTTKVDVSGVTFSGGSSIYNNTSETTAQIGSSSDKTTVKATSGVDVFSTSTNKSVIDATNVIVTGGGIVSVDLAENNDSNNTSAQIIGKTDIDTAGKLTVHSTTNTDISSTKATVSVSGANMVSVSKNEVEASANAKAVIKDATGIIKANGIDIITDYDTMSAFSKANVTAVKLNDIYSGDSSGAKMNAKFTSGIYSEKGGKAVVSDVTINNSGKTTIETAKKTGSKGIEAKAEINNVEVSLIGFVAETTAKAENTAESNTILKAKEHNASSLDVNSYLDSTANATAGATKVSVTIGVNLASTDAKDVSNLNVDIAGKNTIMGNAVIKAIHNADVKSDMSAFNFGGLLGGGQKVRIYSETTANTTGNIGGDFNVNSADIKFTTNRNAFLTRSSGSGSGIVNVDDTKVSNKMNGTSLLNIKDYKSDKSVANNNLAISNASNNTFDITSHNGSGGFINVSEDNSTTTLTATTITNIIDSDINSNNKVSYSAQNNTIVKDTASLGGGGFIAVMTNETTNTYTSSAKLSVQNSTINAGDIELKSSSEIKSAKGDYVDYVGRGGGFIAKNGLYLTNNLNQTSEIEIKNSNLHADNEAKIEAKTSSTFKQKTDSKAGGFTAMPRSKNWLNVTNNNKINVDSSSTIKGDDKLTINFDSDNTLEARAVAEANHVGFRDPWAESYVDLTVNNTLQNDGHLQSGNLVDISFMGGSDNNLTQYAYAEANAWIATTSEDGKITKKITNDLNISSQADITSNKDVEINFSSGGGYNNSTIKWKTTSYPIGFPVTNSKEYSKTDISTGSSLTVNGKIVAGQGNNMYMKINRDGSVDTEATIGLSPENYILTGGKIIDGQEIKADRLAHIQIKIDEAEAELSEINADITDLNMDKEFYEEETTEIQDIINELNDLAESGYIFKNGETDANGDSDYSNVVMNDLKSLIIGNEDNKLTEAEYEALLAAYDNKIQEIEAYNNDENNQKNADYPREMPDFDEILESYSFSSDTAKDTAKKSTIISALDKIIENFGITEKSEYSTYTSLDGNKYLSVTNPKIVDGKQTCDEITLLNNYLAELNEQLKNFENRLDAENRMKDDLMAEIAAWTNEKTAILNTPTSEFAISSEKYAVAFKDIKAKDSHILIEGITNITDEFKGSGILDVAAQNMRVDNYSTRSLIFNDIDMAGTSQSGLIIGGENFSEFAGDGTNQAINGKDAYLYKFMGMATFDSVGKTGAHYMTGSSALNENSGITVNNFYDTFNPFAKSQDILNPTLVSDIVFNGNIKTGQNFSVFNDSGSITAKKLDPNNIKKTTNLVATKGNIDLTSPNNFSLTANSLIFAGNSIDIKAANKVDIAGTVKAGYNADLKLTITDEMLENLAYDPVTGENILINLGNTYYANEENNIKALYKDGQIYLFNINDSVAGINQADRGKVNISSTTASVTGTVKTYDGYQKIEIENKTGKPMIVSNATNQKSAGGLYINGTENDEKPAETVNNAETYVKSAGKLVLDGVIKNNIVSGLANSETFGQLQITANSGLEINKQTNFENNVINSIYDGGVTKIIINNGDANIFGDIDNHGRNIAIENNGTGKLNITGNITNSAINADNYIAIESNGQTEISSAITSKLNGNINIASKGLNLTETSVLDDKKGNIAITNTNGALSVGGKVNNAGGDVTITSSGTSALISGDIDNIGGDISVDNQGGNLELTEIATIDNNGAGNINITNSGDGKFISNAAITNNESGNITVSNSGAKGAEIAGTINNAKGNIAVDNTNGSLEIIGKIEDGIGNINVSNTGSALIVSGAIEDKSGYVTLKNNGAAGLKVEGKVLAEDGDISVSNRDSDLTIGEFASANDNYVQTLKGNINIDQVNGNILNGISDNENLLHQNSNFGTAEKSYKTLLAANGDLQINVKDGNVGYTDNARPGVSIDASTRDWTDSVNVNVSGTVSTQAVNDQKADSRLINLRAKDSDLHIKNIAADGNVILTAADWKQADERPTPDDKAYFTGYSVLSAADGNKATVSGENISIIASNTIGDSAKKLVYMQNTAANPKASVSFEAENDLYVSGKANSNNETNIYQMISKNGSIDLDLASNAAIKEITSGKGLKITQTAQNLTIYDIGGIGISTDTSTPFNDMLNPHDDLLYGFGKNASAKSVVPQYVNIAVLDAVDNSERSDSNLKIYTMAVRGNQGENTQYYADGSRLADVTLMADNIYANSAKAPNSDVSTKENPNGYKQNQTTYTDEPFGGNGTIYEAKGINAFGEGSAITLDILGVDADVVNALVENPQRNGYKEQRVVENIPSRFQNSESSIYDYDFRAKNAVISVNDYVDTERGVEFDTLFADNAYVNTMDTNLTIHDSYITNYAEIRNGNREENSNRYLAVVDNDYRRLVPSNVQLYTQKTGSFGLTMNEKIKFHTMAPIVHYDWDKLVNTFSDENSFVRLGLKETELRQKAKDYYAYGNVYIMPEATVVKYDIWKDSTLFANVKIIELTRNEAVIVNRNGWQIGDEQILNIAFDDVKADIRCKVTDINGNYATVEFLDMPASVYNKLAYRYMKVAGN